MCLANDFAALSAPHLIKPSFHLTFFSLSFILYLNLSLHPFGFLVVLKLCVASF